MLGFGAYMTLGEALRTEEAIYTQMKILNRLDRAAVTQGALPKSFGVNEAPPDPEATSGVPRISLKRC